MTTPKVLVIGSANIDLVSRVPRIPKPGETLIGHTFTTICGGKGANQAVAAARLGAKTTFVGCLGEDGFGAQQRQGLAAEGIDVGHLKLHASEPTGTAMILVADDGQNTIVITPAANFELRPEDLHERAALFAEADVVLLQLEISLETVEAALVLCRDHNVLSVLDCGAAQAVGASLLAKADIVSPNETEMEAITGVRVTGPDDSPQAVAALQALGATTVVLKLGAHGAYYAAPSVAPIHAPAFPVTPVDTVAAGDAFTAALGIAWLSQSPAEALRFACATGALATTREGAQPSMPTRECVETFLAEQESVNA